jgi:protocatechuate 3,4-dioxygenase, alpha subunit
MKYLQTPSQTVGPFFAYGLTPKQYQYDFTEWFDGNLVAENSENVLASDSVATEGVSLREERGRITIKGRVFDGNGAPIPDAMIEFWQEDIQAFGRFGTGTDPQNRFIFQTVKPISQNGQAPFITVVVFMRGLLVHAFTRLYFSDEKQKNKEDEILNLVPENRRNTLIANKIERQGRIEYEFNIVMQGENETVFFDL